MTSSRRSGASPLAPHTYLAPVGPTRCRRCGGSSATREETKMTTKRLFWILPLLAAFLFATNALAQHDHRDHGKKQDDSKIMLLIKCCNILKRYSMIRKLHVSQQ